MSIFQSWEDKTWQELAESVPKAHFSDLEEENQWSKTIVKEQQEWINVLEGKVGEVSSLRSAYNADSNALNTKLLD